MEKHKFTISISGSKKEATEKVNGLAVLAAYLSTDTIKALAKVVKEDPAKVEFAKHYLGVS
ncbi:hypothetical protein SAMN05216474_2156 [Lishizhenia tianjinensis]|jgi:hypothetical protein|uniref:Uncharacterized protein n=2 Tax=Flavobacteriales TaxID=200644 RepID=A0A1I7AJI9_9FLAO|nr:MULTISPECIES: hypothetical protein [Flavobacteriales]MCB9197559.1 hypothetical protein [Flavobacteriales bacterium]CAG5082752.1 hypothetical protein CRYO30217_02000 [Parvicella tangerina]SFT75139.1 hypothetical protein SAMN05216474_2156 [Lishizhenia tianjinensis]